MTFKEYVMEDALEALIDYRGKTPQKSDFGIPTLSAKTVKNNFINYSECYYISTDEYKRFMVRGFPQKGDILLTTEAPLGMVARLDRDDVAIAQRLLTLRGKKDVLDNDYLLYLLQSPYGQGLLKAKETGTTVTGIKQAEFRKIIVKLPDIEIQQKIGSILRSIDDTISINQKINNNLEQQAQTLYKSWFVDFELNSGVMPSDWKVSQLGSIAKISTEVFSPAKNPNVEVEHYSIPAYDEKHYPIFETSNGIKSNKYRLTSNSVMISKLNPDTKRIWRPYCISDNPICSTEFIVYEPLKPLNRDFIYSIIDSIGFSVFLCSHTTGSTNSRQRATPGITLTYDIVVPDEKTIQAFCSIVSPMYDTIENNIKENQKLAETRDKLLPKLMSGELDVSDIAL